MSSQLISVFLASTPIHLDGVEAQVEGEPELVWKVVLRTGTWKMRPGPGGVKLKEPLKIYRDKAPKGHISMASLKSNFDAGAKENVTLPAVHADGTTSDSGFVRKLVIQDVAGENGSKTKESLLWAGIEVTDSEVKRKITEKSLVGVSGGILFDYERTEDAKKFDQVLSHVMVTNSPWINGTGGFQNKLPEGVMAAEPDDLPIGEADFETRETEAPDPQLPVVTLDDPLAKTKPTGAVIWKPEEGFGYTRDKVSRALRDWRSMLMNSVPESQRYTLDWPYFSVSDVSLDTSGGKALISSGYGAECDSWVATFKYDDQGEVELQPFAEWTVAKQEWVAASEDQPAPKPSVRPAGRDRPESFQVSSYRAPGSLADLGLREAQTARAERMRLGTTSTTIGGHMGRLTDLLSGVELSDEQREAIRAEEERVSRFETDEATRRERDRQAQVAVYCGSPDGQKPGLLDELGLGDPGVKKYVRNALLSDDGGPAIELSEHTDAGKTAGVPKTATELLKGFIEILPKDDKGRVSLAEQARRLPDDNKPPEDNEDKPVSAKDSADALLAEMHAQGLAGDLIMAKEA